MFRVDKPIYKVILLINMIFIVVGIAFSFMNYSTSTSIQKIYKITNITGLVFALFYILLGYTKNSSGFYKSFSVLYLISQAIGLCSIFINSIPRAYIFTIIGILAELVIIFKKDFGKKKSLIFCGIIVIAVIGSIINVILLGHNTFDAIVRGRLVDLILSLLFTILTYAKYMDKADRGTK